MNPAEVHRVLLGIAAQHLFHANSVTTSCTFLKQGGLLSRRYVEDRGLVQTPQYSDDDDKKYGIWSRIFVDHVDIHYRGGRTKGPNQYGPVLFVLPTDFLLKLPKGSEVSVARKNPVNWKEKEPVEERWFRNVEELEENLSYGDFDKMLVIKAPSGTLSFPRAGVEIFLDDPKRELSPGKDAYAHAEKRLGDAAVVGKVKVSINPHQCRNDCSCIEKYGHYNSKYFGRLFG